MVNVPLIRIKCETCQIKIPKAQPKLFCTICDKLKHLSCQKLTKADAINIIYQKIPWTCRECILEILPVNACSSVRSFGKNPSQNSKSNALPVMVIHILL